MLKVSKRTRGDWGEDMNVVPTCSPHKITTLDSTPTKKPRPINEQNNTNQSGFIFEPLRPDSPFQMTGTSENDKLEKFLQVKPRKLPKAQNETTERMFSYNEVKEIVERAVAEKEASLRVEYDRILQERLQEQFRNFSKFNEDYISRQYKSSDFSYLS